ncbi:hypothetical protein LUZ60_002518 [Juncus effusus]|nr:hypothetical protein LUZ60_002518 [Juncus effusus]
MRGLFEFPLRRCRFTWAIYASKHIQLAKYANETPSHNINMFYTSRPYQFKNTNQNISTVSTSPNDSLNWKGPLISETLIKNLEASLQNKNFEEAWIAFNDYKRSYGFPDQSLLNAFITSLSYSSSINYLNKAYDTVFTVFEAKPGLLKPDPLTRLALSLARAGVPVHAANVLYILLETGTTVFLELHKDLFRNLKSLNAKNEAQSRRLEHVRAFRVWAERIIMALEGSPIWRQKATNFFSTSGVKLKQAGQSAGGNVADVAGRVGSIVKSRWAVFQESRQRNQEEWAPPKETVQEKIITAAASTSVLLRKGLSETKEKVSVGKLKVEEAAKKTLNNIERWQKGVGSNDVFGVPIEVIAQRERSLKAVPQVLITCADYLVVSGLGTEFLFKSEGDKKTIRRLVSHFNQDWKASVPDGTNPIEIASLIKCYLASLPEPLTTFSLFLEIREARSNIRELRNILKKLPNVNFMTLEFVTALLLRVSQKSSLNKMDSRSLSVEMAHLMMWQKDDSSEERRDHYRNIALNKTGPTRPADLALNATNSWDYLEEEDDDVQIPLDDASPPDYGAIEVIQCLIEHHNAVFTDANETVWR